MLRIVGDEPVFETGLLLAGDCDAADVRRQLSRWTRQGKLHQIRRGLYCLAPPYEKTHPDPFLVANRAVSGSYVSLQSALAFHGMIPEYVPITTSVTTGRARQIRTPLGDFLFKHVKRSLFFGYTRVRLIAGQEAYVAAPEKALLDLVHLTPGGDRPEYLESLRLQCMEDLDLECLHDWAARTGSPKLQRAVQVIERLACFEVWETRQL